MLFKIDTKEKFHELTVNQPSLAANMTADLEASLSECQHSPPFNVVLSLEGVRSIDQPIAELLVKLQGRWYENSRSFVICCIDTEAEEQLDTYELLELLNVTPTVSEAWDIVQMEEIERELLDGLD